VEALLLEASEASLVRRTVKEWGSKLAGALVSGRAGEARRGEAGGSRGGGRCMQQGARLFGGVVQQLSHSGVVFLLVQGAATASGDDEGGGNGNEGSVGVGNWAAVKDASIRLGKSASRKGLARVASLVSEAGSGRANSSSQQQQEAQGLAARQIPVIEQRPEADQARQQQQQPRQIPVIDMSQAPEQQQQQQDRQRQEQQQEEEEQGRDVVLPYSCGFDNPMAEAAVAQEASVADRNAAPLAAPGGGNGGPGDPEHLFPPGARRS
jgi:hypothetical protein